ncbi:MAG: Ig-like domain-containing protein, partial [Thermodesulfobacteriota bacterium]|nr:Ig-like domain-containing protein [Thermodesulfobacteriota bacterium]
MAEYTTLSGVNSIDALLWDAPTWNSLPNYAGNTVYFTFSGGGGNREVSRLTLFNSAMKDAAREILDHAATISGINFVETSNSNLAHIFFYGGDLSGDTTAGITYIQWYDETIDTNTIYLDIYDFPDSRDPDPGETSYETLLHEIGHSLGLDHPHDDIILTDVPDNTSYTVMSYNEVGSPKSTFQSLDLAALQWIYGGDGIRGDWGIDSIYGSTVEELDFDPPNLVSSTPIEKSSAVGLEQNIIIAFDEAISLDQNNVNLIIETIDGSIRINSTWAIHGNYLTIDPVNPLAYDTDYQLTIGDDLIKDLADNLFTGTTLRFTTIRNGTAVDDTLSGSTLDDYLEGYAGNDLFLDHDGFDILNGGEGIDSAEYDDQQASYTISRVPSNSQWKITSLNGEIDTLINIERLLFHDSNLALDLTGNAGIVAKTMGVIFGADSLNNSEYI